MSAIDPGTEAGIDSAAEKIESDRGSGELEQRDEDDFLQPGRWWFASTACPLLAGTFGPMASGFNICALCTYWREILPPPDSGMEASQLPDPQWLLSINALSLLSAVIGNAALLLNMARRLKFSVAQPITIAGFSLAGALLIAIIGALTSSPDYFIADPVYQPAARHALTSSFYFAIFAAIIYVAISALMCMTVYGAMKDHYTKEFQLTSSQRTLMLQTMSFVTYLLLGALIFNTIEGWGYMNAVFWADVTLLTVGLGDFSPKTNLGRGLLFPYAIGGVLIVGLVVGSIRSLILERGKQKISARILEKRRKNAVHNVDARRETIQISMFAKADFTVDPNLSPAQRRENEFNVMRKVQSIAADERKYFALGASSTFVFILWFVGAAIFMKFEAVTGWTYFESLYFSFTSLMTIGYGDFSPKSHGGRAFFVFWTLLAVPSLTILISNMGDTVVRWVSDLTNWVARLTVLPTGEGGIVASLRQEFLTVFGIVSRLFKSAAPGEHAKQISDSEHDEQMSERLYKRLAAYIDKSELSPATTADDESRALDKDILFYNYVLARECHNLQKDSNETPQKQYPWQDWEYFLKLIGNEESGETYPGQNHPNVMVPKSMKAPEGLSSTLAPSNNTQDPTSVDGNIDRQTSALEGLEAHRKEYRKGFRHPDIEPSHLRNWSWLSNESPLMSNKSEPAWILDRLTAALERELHRQRKGYKTRPPISFAEAKRSKLRMLREKEKGIEEDVVQPYEPRNQGRQGQKQ